MIHPESDLLAEALKRYEASETNRQIEILASRISQLAEQTIVQNQRDFRLNEKIDDLKSEIRTMHGEISEIREYANKWRGGFYAITAAGGVLGAIVIFWDKVKAIWH